jgi:hypothetical protein
VAKISTKKNGVAKLMMKIACTAALGVSGAAQADVLNFEGNFDSPFLFHQDHVQIGNFWIETYGGSRIGEDLVGAIIDGSQGSDCLTGGCPVNNPSQYYAGLDDGYMYFGLNNDSGFRLSSLKASFMGAGQTSFPAVAGLLQLQGFNANGVPVGVATQLVLAGPQGGQFRFSTYDLPALSNTFVSYYQVAAFACNAAGQCNRNTNAANFALDDINVLPEPTSIALFGLGALGMAAAARRRRRVL